MNFAKSALAFIGSLAGYLAGISAILYACGYLVTRAHVNALGLYGLFEYQHEHFVQEGAKFVIVISQWVAGIGLRLLMAIIVIAVPGLLIYWGLRRYLGRLPARWKTWGDRLARANVGNIGWSVVYLLLFFLLVVHSDAYLGKFGQPLLVSNLLYTDTNESNDGPDDRADAARIRKWLLHGDDGSTVKYFQYLLWGFALSGGLLFASLMINIRWAIGRFWRGLLIAPFVISFSMYLFLLPMTYGVLVRPTKYPRIAIVVDPRGDAPGDSTALFLLNKTGQEFVVWDAADRRVIWIPAGKVKRAEIHQVENLFGRRQRTP